MVFCLPGDVSVAVELAGHESFGVPRDGGGPVAAAAQLLSPVRPLRERHGALHAEAIHGGHISRPRLSPPRSAVLDFNALYHRCTGQ